MAAGSGRIIDIFNTVSYWVLKTLLHSIGRRAEVWTRGLPIFWPSGSMSEGRVVTRTCVQRRSGIALVRARLGRSRMCARMENAWLVGKGTCMTE